MGNISEKNPCFWCSTDVPDQTQYNADWMSKLPDSRMISDMSIPGTHDTMTYTTKQVGSGWVWCQSWPLRVQLNMGVRFLDLRCRHFRNSLPLHHDSFFLDTHFDKVLSEIVMFLRDHPSEVVIANVQEEYKPEENSPNISFDDTVKSYLGEVDSYVYKYMGDIPTLRELRGKMIIMSNKEYATSPFLPWSTFNISNDWDNVATDTKWSGVKNHLDRARGASRHDYFLSFSSHTYKWFVWYSRANVARSMNPILHSYVSTTDGRLGMIAIDYPGPKLIKDIIGHNFKSHVYVL